MKILLIMFIVMWCSIWLYFIVSRIMDFFERKQVIQNELTVKLRKEETLSSQKTKTVDPIQSLFSDDK